MTFSDEIKRMMEADAAMRRAIDPYAGMGSYLQSSLGSQPQIAPDTALVPGIIDRRNGV
jgi:hypothetical protein